jgi:hypothetical protein
MAGRHVNAHAGKPRRQPFIRTFPPFKAVIALIGPHGIGNTQQYERELAIVRQSREPAFEVILPETTTDRPFDFLQVIT